jgi:GNAT superfamily N-acetyltransferase
VTVDVRVATPDDLDDLVAVHTQARTAYYRAGGAQDGEFDNPEAAAERRDGWRHMVELPQCRVLCAVRDGTVIGVAGMGEKAWPAEAEPRVGQLFQIHVRADHWGTGVGSALHDGFVEFLRERELATGRIEAWERIARAQSFYARRGWRPTPHRRPGVAGGDFVELRLDLALA